MVDYSYILPNELIASEPRNIRDSARLFVYNTKNDTVHFAHVHDLPDILPHPSLLVLNDTKVVPARLYLKKDTGGIQEILVLTNQMKEGDTLIPIITSKKIIVGRKLFLPDGAFLEIISQNEQIFYCKPSFVISELFSYLDRFGETPLPHYLNSHIEEVLAREKYQTVYATNKGSVAAPTASLHFTYELLEKLSEKNIPQTKITLHVGMGTFAPITEENFNSKTLHKERFELSEKSATKINEAKRNKIPIIAVGTTVARTLESITRSNNGEITPLSGETDIFIFPPYTFKAVDILMTNFHLPNTSLMHLVQAFLEHKGAKRDVRELYEIAIKEKFAFYSFGDSMLIV